MSVTGDKEALEHSVRLLEQAGELMLRIDACRYCSVTQAATRLPRVYEQAAVVRREAAWHLSRSVVGASPDGHRIVRAVWHLAGVASGAAYASPNNPRTARKTLDELRAITDAADTLRSEIRAMAVGRAVPC